MTKLSLEPSPLLTSSREPLKTATASRFPVGSLKDSSIKEAGELGAMVLEQVTLVASRRIETEA